MNIVEILKEVPLSAVLTERIKLEQAKSEFEVSKAKSSAEAAESRSIDLTAQLNNEKQEHHLTRQKLQEALKEISRLAAQPQPLPKVAMKLPGGRFRSPI